MISAVKFGIVPEMLAAFCVKKFGWVYMRNVSEPKEEELLSEDTSKEA